MRRAAVPGLAIAAIAALLPVGAVEYEAASDRANLVLASAAGAGWALENLRADLRFEPATADVRIARLVLPDPIGRLEDVSVHCPRIVLSPRVLECPAAKIGYRDAAGEAVVYEALIAYTAATRSVRLAMPAVAIAGGSVSFSATTAPSGTTLNIAGSGLSVPELYARLSDGGTGELDVASGAAHLEFEFRLDADGRGSGAGEAEITDFAFSNASGRLAAEGIVARTVVSLAREPGEPWGARIEAGIGAGGVYAEPVYLDFSAFPLALDAHGSVDPDAGRVRLERFRIEQPGLARLAGSLSATRAQPLERLVLEVEQAALPGAYDTYLKGVLVGTPFDRLDSSGSITGRLEVENAETARIAFAISNLNLEDRDGRFALYGADGDLHWQRSEKDARDSRFAFAGGFLYGAGFDAAELNIALSGSRAELLAPVRIPMLGGALGIRAFSVTDWDSDDITLELEAEVEPIELRQLTVAVGWPAFSGTLSGRLPLLNYRGGVVTLGGNLEAQAFDGDISIEDLRIDRPFGVVPAFAATIRLRNLDLGLVTDVVPFGSVSGRLDGDIENLRMLKGEPIGFNASFRTPEDDDSKHRISQRAVGTISKVAGGSGAVLSSTFLRVFQSFPYKRLGISCRLENDVCHMDGIAPADGGYYIVEGSLLPRLNLLGRVREVNWSRLMGQLNQALEEGKLEID